MCNGDVFVWKASSLLDIPKLYPHKLLDMQRMPDARFCKSAEKAPVNAAIRPDTGMSSRSTVIGLSIFEIVDPTITTLDWRWLPVR